MGSRGWGEGEYKVGRKNIKIYAKGKRERRMKDGREWWKRRLGKVKCGR